MKLTIKKICIIFLIYNQTNSYFCSISSWQNLNKQKLIIGDCHRFIKLSDKYLLVNLLKKLDINNKEVLIIFESELILENLDIKNFKNISSKILDLRTNNIFLFINIYRSIIKASNKIENYKVDNFVNKELFDIFFLNNLELLKQDLEKMVDQIKNKIKNLNTSNTNREYINNLFLKLETQFNDFKNNYNLYKNLENQSKILEFLDVLELDLPDLGFILEIINNKDYFDLIIIITGNDHAVSINNFLEKTNYKLIEQIGLNKYWQNNHPSVLSEQDIINIFNKIG